MIYPVDKLFVVQSFIPHGPMADPPLMVYTDKADAEAECVTRAKTTDASPSKWRHEVLPLHVYLIVLAQCAENQAALTAPTLTK